MQNHAGAGAAPLFGDQGPLGLLAEEAWPGALPAHIFSYLPTGSAAVSVQGDLTLLQQQQQQQQTLDQQQQGDLLQQQQQQQQQRASERGQQQRQRQFQQCQQHPQDGDLGDEADSDDDSEYEGYDVREDLAADAWNATAPQTLQLRAVAKALSKTDDVNGVLKALGHVELLVRVVCGGVQVLHCERI